MALTNQQLISLGFKPSVRGRKGLSKLKKYDSLIFALNETDFLYTGYNPYSKKINYKTIWKSFKNDDGERITYQVVNLGETGFTELRGYIARSIIAEVSKQFALITEESGKEIRERYPEVTKAIEDTKICNNADKESENIEFTKETPEIDG